MRLRSRQLALAAKNSRERMPDAQAAAINAGTTGALGNELV